MATKAKKVLSAPEEMLALQLRAERFVFSREVSGLIPKRKYRVDFFIGWNLVVEVQGGIWTKGGHSTGTGITRDCEKLNLLQIEGYRVLHVTPDHIKSGKALEWIKACL